MVSCTCNMSPENKGTDITWVQKIYILKQNTYKTPHLKRSGVAANYWKVEIKDEVYLVTGACFLPLTS